VSRNSIAAGKASWRGSRTVVPRLRRAPAWLHHAEGGVGRGDADVDPAEHLHAPATHGPPTAATIGLYSLTLRSTGVDAVGQPAPSTSFTSPEAICFWSSVTWGNERLEVGARHEGIVDAGDDGDPRIRVVLEPPPRAGQVAEVVHVEGVARLGPVDGDDGDVVVAHLVVDGHSNLTR